MTYPFYNIVVSLLQLVYNFIIVFPHQIKAVI